MRPLCRSILKTFPRLPSIFSAPETDPLRQQLLATETSKAEAHESFLSVSNSLAETMSNHLAFQMALIEALIAEPAALMPVVPEVAPALDRGQWLEFAVGSIRKVLGPEFAEIDAYPTRVRLPDEPLMLVDRIMAIEGEPLTLKTLCQFPLGTT